jgi:hypothetical protein
MTAAESSRRHLRRADSRKSKTREAKLRAIAEASRRQFPTADIDVMLKEIEAGRRLVPPTR